MSILSEPPTAPKILVWFFSAPVSKSAPNQACLKKMSSEAEGETKEALASSTYRTSAERVGVNSVDTGEVYDFWMMIKSFI